MFSKQPKNRGLNKEIVLYIYTMKNYSDVRKRKKFVAVWMELENIMLSEVRRGKDSE